jgi:cation transport ATPase
MAKGQQVVEQQLGVKLDTTSSETLRQKEMEHEEWLLEMAVKQKELDIDAEKAAQTNVTERWKADMLSDSWLSKNIRPLVLCFLLLVYTMFSITSGFGFTVTQAYVELLAQMLMLVMAAYFAGRTVEKVVDMKERGK